MCGCRAALEQLDHYKDDFVKGIAYGSFARPLLTLSVPAEVLASARSVSYSDGVIASGLNLDPGRRYARLLAEGPCHLGRFQLLSVLGDGAFGYVFRAHDPELDRNVAVKIQRVGSLAGEGDARRFFREAQSAAQLQHPGIVTLFECGRTEDDVFFLVTEYVDGETLEVKQQKCQFETSQPRLPQSPGSTLMPGQDIR